MSISLRTNLARVLLTASCWIPVAAHAADNAIHACTINTTNEICKTKAVNAGPHHAVKFVTDCSENRNICPRDGTWQIRDLDSGVTVGSGRWGKSGASKTIGGLYNTKGGYQLTMHNDILPIFISCGSGSTATCQDVKGRISPY